jgi:hypothetical protein
MKAGTYMKKYILLLTILVSIAGWSGNGFCQTPILGCPKNDLNIPKQAVGIQSVRNDPILANGTYFAVAIYSENPTWLMNGLERIYTQNTDSDIDGHVYEFELTPTLRGIIGEFSILKKFEGQYGMYAVTIERIERSTNVPYSLTCYTDPIEDDLIPLPVPKNLKVSFKSGATTPTLSFDPVGGFPSDSDKWYEIRIYDKDYTRRIYSVKIGTGDNCGSAPCSKKDDDPSVTYPAYRSVWGQTYEDLVPGEEYIFRADLMKELQGGPMIQGTNFKSFKVPKK